jgi:excisionase family DNA binding protein
MAPRFITLADVADTLALSSHQTYQLVRSGQLRAIKIGGQWRVEVAELESFVERMYEQTETYLQSTEGDEESVGPLSSPS